MKTVRILLVGAGGYGNVYIDYFKNKAFDCDVILVGVVDPFVEKSPGYAWLLEQKIPLYQTLEDFFKENTVDLTIVATPTPLHSPYSIFAMKNGSHVLCEKPLTPTVQELDRLEEERQKADRKLAVGFQWSFSETMCNLKRDILNGVFGKPKMMKTFISWKRVLSYYNTSDWKGRIRTSKGAYILDSIVTNATAHYLHNVCFLLGDSMGSSAYPDNFAVELYRVKEIDTFDTCCIKGEIAGGKFLYIASHATDAATAPKFSYEFENATILFNDEIDSNEVVAHFHDGRTISYKNPFAADSRKVQAMVDFIRAGAEVTCTIPTVRPHLLTCNAIFDFATVYNFPKEKRIEVVSENPDEANIYCDGLHTDLLACYRAEKLPSEQQISWSKPATQISLDGYTAYQGGDFSTTKK